MGLGGNSGSGGAGSAGSRASAGWVPAPTLPGRCVTPSWAPGLPLNLGCGETLEEGDLLRGCSWGLGWRGLGQGCAFCNGL